MGPEGEPTGETPEGISREVESTQERTRESEIRANIEYWQSLGIKLEEQEVRTAVEAVPEREGYNWIIVIPQGTKIWQLGSQVASFDSDLEFRNLAEVIEMSRKSNETYAIAAHYRREVDKDSIGRKAKTAKNWENTGEEFMTPLECIIAEGRWYKDNKNHLNAKTLTLCPGSRSENGQVPYLEYSTESNPPQEFMRVSRIVKEIILDSCSPEKRHRSLGVRRVITKDSK